MGICRARCHGRRVGVELVFDAPLWRSPTPAAAWGRCLGCFASSPTQTGESAWPQPGRAVPADGFPSWERPAQRCSSGRKMRGHGSSCDIVLPFGGSLPFSHFNSSRDAVHVNQLLCWRGHPLHCEHQALLLQLLCSGFIPPLTAHKERNLQQPSLQFSQLYTFLKQVVGRGVGGQGWGRKALLWPPPPIFAAPAVCSSWPFSFVHGHERPLAAVPLHWPQGLGHTAFSGATLVVSTLHGGRCQYGLAAQTIGGRTFS